MTTEEAFKLFTPAEQVEFPVYRKSGNVAREAVEDVLLELGKLEDISKDRYVAALEKIAREDFNPYLCDIDYLTRMQSYSKRYFGPSVDHT